ncbi:hypothetical protein P8C59_008619 [Phyllachora maydis]|uniref:Reverse transcriptase Ty1/copia-type domain-containing protein n=1 Tax=Phyllachora maydis TaxID=1825666 RepID=A0AAD9IB30_9PEZI|nr:hypothetical protein P8C59_008619 [Phyllachora maydis]
MANILEESRNPAIEAYRAAHIANSSNSTPNSNSNPSKKGKNKKKGKKKASYNIKGQNYSAKSAKQASFMLGSYNLAIEEEEESNSSSDSMEIPSNSIRKEDYRPIIEDAIVSKAIEPEKRYKLRNSPAKGTTLEGAPYQSPYKTREPKPLTGTRDLPHVLRELVIEGKKVEKAISSPTLKEPIIEEDITSHLYNSTEIKLYQSLEGTAIYIMLLTRYLNSTKDYSICFSYNGNTVANLGPKLSNSSNTTTKLSRDFHSKEGPRPLTTTSTTIVDSRNGKGSSRTSIINSSLVPIGFSDSDFTGDKATSKSTYSYLYKLAGSPISWKTKRATTTALSTLEAETNRLTEAIRKVQWIIGLFSKLYRPIDHPITLYGDNQGYITVANNPALHTRTKYTLLKFRYVREQVKAKIVTIIYLNTNLLLGF